MATSQFIAALLAESQERDEMSPIRQLQARCIGSGYNARFIPVGQGNQRYMSLVLTRKTQQVVKDVEDKTVKNEEAVKIFDPSKPSYSNFTMGKRAVARYALGCLRDTYTQDLSGRIESDFVEGEFPVKLLRIFKANFNEHIEIKFAKAQAAPNLNLEGEALAQPSIEGGIDDDDSLGDLSDVSEDFEDFDPSTMVLAPEIPRPQSPAAE